MDKISAIKDLLTAILQCGEDDLEDVLDCKYDMNEVIKECKVRYDFSNFDINDLFYVIFCFGVEEMRKDILAEIEHLKEESNIYPLEDDDLKRLNTLTGLNPIEDIDVHTNFSATYIYFNFNEEIYSEYCSDKLEHLEDMTGIVVQY